MNAPDKAVVIEVAIDAALDAGGIRTLAAMAMQEQAEKLLARAKRIASEDGGWRRVRPSSIVVSFVRTPKPHYVYMDGVERLTEKRALALVMDALLTAGGL